MNHTERRNRMRKHFSGNQCLSPASVFDALSARVAESVGYEIGMLAGSTASSTTLAAPDLIVLTLTEFADQIRRIMRASTLSLLVDADHGYGNALNVMRTVEECEHSGVSAMSIEDTVLPRAFGEKTPSLTSLDEGIGKMRAAMAAREDKALVIIGRTSAAQISGPEEALKRARAYEKEGVDALFFAGGITRDLLEALHAEIRIPLMMGGGNSVGDKAYLGSKGVRVALQGHQPFSAAVQATYDTLKALREGVKPSELKGVASAETMARVTRTGTYKTWTEKFLT